MADLLLGAVADDYTGAADLASMLREGGARTALVFGDALGRLSAGRPAAGGAGFAPGAYDAVVVALRSRSAPAGEARADALRALAWLRALGARQVQFKYCSTFDSTPAGNIGPVTDALMDALGTDFTVAVPALPVNGRTQYMGHLFVGGRLVSETHMRHHPVTPMTDPDLVRHLRPQTRRAVGLIPLDAVRAGAAAVRAAAERLRGEGVGIALVDAAADADLAAIADAAAELPLVTGGSGIGAALPGAWRRRGWFAPRQISNDVPDADARAPGAPRGVVVLAGSCSAVTLEQLGRLRAAGGEGFRLDPRRLLAPAWEGEADRLADALAARVRGGGWAWMYSSADAAGREPALREAEALGVPAASVRERLERAAGRVARRLVDAGVVGGVVVAGGETTGAVAEALALGALELGPALAPGVPVLRALGGPPLRLVFKSGNFGGPDFLLEALRHFGVGPGAAAYA